MGDQDISPMPPSGMFTHKQNLVRLHRPNCMPDSCEFKNKITVKDYGLFSASPKSVCACWMMFSRTCFPKQSLQDGGPLYLKITMQQNYLHTLFHIIMEITNIWDNNTPKFQQDVKSISISRLFGVLQSKVMDIEYCLAYIHKLSSTRDSSLTVSTTNLSRNVVHFA